MGNYEDKIYSLDETVLGQTQAMSQVVQKTLENNGGVGIMTGYYDQNLSILSVSNLLLHSTGHTFDTFMEQTKGSLKNFFYNEEDILDRNRFLYIKILVSEQGNAACEKLSNCHNLLIMRNDKKDYRNSQHFAFAF